MSLAEYFSILNETQKTLLQFAGAFLVICTLAFNAVSLEETKRVAEAAQRSANAAEEQAILANRKMTMEEHENSVRRQEERQLQADHLKGQIQLEKESLKWKDHAERMGAVYRLRMDALYRYRLHFKEWNELALGLIRQHRTLNECEAQETNCAISVMADFVPLVDGIISQTNVSSTLAREFHALFGEQPPLFSNDELTIKTFNKSYLAGSGKESRRAEVLEEMKQLNSLIVDYSRRSKAYLEKFQTRMVRESQEYLR